MAETALNETGQHRRTAVLFGPQPPAADAAAAQLVSILAGSPFRPRQAAAVGHALVEADFVGADVLGRTLRVLMLRLNRAADREDFAPGGNFRPPGGHQPSAIMKSWHPNTR